MKRSQVWIMVLAMAFMTSCLVSSLHPFFKKEDKFFDTTMVGYWMDGDSCIWTIFPNMVSEGFMKPSRPDSSYQIIYYEDESKYSILSGTLFQINGVNYVDFTPAPKEDHCTSDMTSFHHVPVHTLARVQYSKDSILIYWYGDNWLNDLFEQNRIRIKHETVNAGDYDRQLLTADTEELQKFIRKYANDPKTAEDIEEIFAKGSTDGQEDYGVFMKLKPYNGELPENIRTPEGSDSVP
ncbi:MAG: hypothetical protein V2B15_01255 [Bacteroidota bacterium]